MAGRAGEDALRVLHGCVEVNSGKHGKKPVLRGTRYLISTLFAELSEGCSITELAEDHDLDKEQLRELLEGSSRWCLTDSGTMNTFQLDQCASSHAIVEACEKEGHGEALLLARTLHNSQDRDLVPVVMAGLPCSSPRIRICQGTVRA